MKGQYHNWLATMYKGYLIRLFPSHKPTLRLIRDDSLPGGVGEEAAIRSEMPYFVKMLFANRRFFPKPPP